MNRKNLCCALILAVLYSFSCSINAQAAIPVWTFTPLTATTLSIESNRIAIIKYLVTNQSPKTHKLVMKPIPGIYQVSTLPEQCKSPFSLDYQQSCILTLKIEGKSLEDNVTEGPIVCQAGVNDKPSPFQCYQPNANNRINIFYKRTPGTAAISASVSSLTLSVHCDTPSASCTSSNAALTGNPREITITNTSNDFTAFNVQFSAPNIPLGTTITPNGCNILLPNTFCTATISPGQIPSSAPGDPNPSPVTLSISGTNTNTVTTELNIVTYGSAYQSGFLFSIDDTTAPSTSIGGKVVAMANQSTSIPWDPGCPGGCTNPINANNHFDGAVNTSNITTALSASHGPNTYAAGLCIATSIGGYSDWYLPAICELGYGANSASPCGEQANPAIQNIQSNLVDNNVLALANNFWSSTQASLSTTTSANQNNFSIPGLQQSVLKEQDAEVRCVRIVTPQ